MIRRLALALALLFAAGTAPRAEPAAPAALNAAAEAAAPDDSLDLDSSAQPLGGVLRAPDLWAAYKARFITEQGRVVDFANGAISHSEGQGYAMLFAVAANDRIAFDRLWGWTRANLMVRDDQLLAWRWEPNARPAVADMNDAADGDILVAWALIEAAEFWKDESYRVAARRIAVEVGRKLLLLGGKDGPLLLPAVAGFAREDRADGPVINLSYWIFPAFQRLPDVAPEVDWSGLIHSGLRELKAARFGPASLPSDWISARDNKTAPADGFPRVFSYNAIRIPLYMAMAGVGERADYAPFVTLWAKDRTEDRTKDRATDRALATIDVDTGAASKPLGEPGYQAIPALLACLVEKRAPGFDLFAPAIHENYYPATLRVFAAVALRLRHESCVKS